ncbi:MarR family winged helix-turn-helix transcriptional regulator [Streptomyces sp. BBFR51]|uniref:MarR family winged helix-turn-helix transcriptional regulator n=1 Tax=Streptomyces sp. BBFR51 TaxID=3372856 RepID=UPI0037DC9C51
MVNSTGATGTSHDAGSRAAWRPPQPWDPCSPRLRAARLAEELFEERLRRQPGRTITNVGDFDLLQTLRQAAPGHALTPGQLMRHLVVSSTGLSGRLNRLERDGWIVRTASPDDRPRSLVSLTMQGREEFDRRLESHLAVECELLSVLDARERVVVGA